MKSSIWVVSADMHFPHVHRPTFDAMLDFIRRNRRKIAGYLDLGDTFDNGTISPHTKGKAIYQVPGSFKAETEAYRREILAPLEAALPKKAKRVVITGNHTRWEQDFTDSHPELIGVVDRYADLKLAEKGWEIIPLGMHYRIGNLICIHGDQIGGAYGAGAVPARKAVETYSGNVLMGHTHSPQSYTRVSPVDSESKWMGYVAPTMGTVNAHFMRNKPNAWANGLTLVDVRPDGAFNLYLIQTVNGQFSFGGDIYGRPEKKKRV